MRTKLSALLLVVACSSSAGAQGEACSDAVAEYNGALEAIDSAIRRYSRCVEGSQGSDDCSSPFRRLRSAQGDFEVAVSNHQAYCPPR